MLALTQEPLARAKEPPPAEDVHAESPLALDVASYFPVFDAVALPDVVVLVAIVGCFFLCVSLLGHRSGLKVVLVGCVQVYAFKGAL